MYSEQLLIDAIKLTGYDVRFAEELAVSATTFEVPLPRIDVGHIGIKVQYPERLFADGYTENENPKMLITAVRTICTRLDFPIVWQNVYDSFKDFTPFLLDGDYSHIIYLKGDAIAKTHTHIIWEDLVGIAFPRVS